ncbi:uncharacterized protein LOC106869323 [Octopus bimaculoides]|uniref:uncharacterized protein LOC106869323 n=1 Tax=Octopus bimaculoides TaxID=37653 RepID=UPI00071C4C17|nr:uncharacterized protein LOC106869323 [Octopus bimaculoides]|eukprot:XP_014770511.1 PREDICTED: uncharacterized protein LOC106869323 [Octopus bimaculoides]
MVRQARGVFERNLESQAKSNPKRFYAHVQRNKRLYNRVVALRDVEGNIVTDSTSQSLLFAVMFSSIYRIDDGRETLISGRQIEPMPPVTISSHAVYIVPSKLHQDKSVSSDSVHPAVLRVLARILAAPLASLFNLSLEQGNVPEDWWKATVCPIFKKGSNYRLVSLTSILCKVMETIVKKSLMNHILTSNAIPDSQHGFLPRRFCLTNLEEWITRTMDEKDSVDVVFLDFTKVFDSVNHRLLLRKLQAYKIQPLVTSWISSFLSHRTFRV